MRRASHKISQQSRSLPMELLCTRIYKDYISSKRGFVGKSFLGLSSIWVASYLNILGEENGHC